LAANVRLLVIYDRFTPNTGRKTAKALTAAFSQFQPFSKS
jgi:hypothetical protein